MFSKKTNKRAQSSKMSNEMNKKVTKWAKNDENMVIIQSFCSNWTLV